MNEARCDTFSMIPLVPVKIFSQFPSQRWWWMHPSCEHECSNEICVQNSRRRTLYSRFCTFFYFIFFHYAYNSHHLHSTTTKNHSNFRHWLL